MLGVAVEGATLGNENLPQWAKSFPHDLINDAAARHKLKTEFIYAICQQESAGRTFATRFERELYVKHLQRVEQGRLSYFLRPENFAKLCHTTAHTERAHQMTSWGLMQVCGFKAREMGYAEPLPMLCLPHVGLELGCRALRKFLDRYDGNYRAAVCAYNAGSFRYVDGKIVNQEYLESVIALASELGESMP